MPKNKQPRGLRDTRARRVSDKAYSNATTLRDYVSVSKMFLLELALDPLSPLAREVLDYYLWRADRQLHATSTVEERARIFRTKKGTPIRERDHLSGAMAELANRGVAAEGSTLDHAVFDYDSLQTAYSRRRDCRFPECVEAGHTGRVWSRSDGWLWQYPSTEGVSLHKASMDDLYEEYRRRNVRVVLVHAGTGAELAALNSGQQETAQPLGA